jgi:hypothetical protein
MTREQWWMNECALTEARIDTELNQLKKDVHALRREVAPTPEELRKERELQVFCTMMNKFTRALVRQL